MDYLRRHIDPSILRRLGLQATRIVLHQQSDQAEIRMMMQSHIAWRGSFVAVGRSQGIFHRIVVQPCIAVLYSPSVLTPGSR